MAVYQKLLLSTGGGIISSKQQAEQAENTASVMIGLGGTGVHCIRTIKTQVYSRLKPDDEKAVVPGYSHIRFIGIDTTEKSRGGALDEQLTDETRKADSIMSLSDTEFFSIANSQVARAFTNPLALKQREELTWLEYEKIKAPNLTDAGAGGIRQVGRFMMMDRSADFLSKLEQEINAAKKNLTSPRVNVHIFAGLSGGTGSGCFLDVCYMVRALAEKLGGITVFGYFFLPDVNLSKIPYENTNVRTYIPKNGYAAMQELDYCMRLGENGGAFEQVYKGHNSIKWSKPPVDMCHLICATDKDNNVLADAYDYAMNVTAEYIMDFLTASEEEFGLSEHLANFRAMISQTDEKKTIGSEMAYCVIGASCASIPLREINTYLAAELFDKFGVIRSNVPTKEAVEGLAVSTLARGARFVNEIYDSLFNEVREAAMGEFVAYPDDFKVVRDYGNDSLVTHYTNQRASQENRIEANAKSMLSEENTLSLISRVKTGLIDVLCDINRGPIYAYGMLSASASHNLLNIVDGLIQENGARYSQEAAQNDLRRNDYENARMNFERKPKQKQFQDYEYYLMVLQQHELWMVAYQKLDEVLRKFREQLVDATANYYIKLSRVMDTLMNTFAENRNSLANQDDIRKHNRFDVPMMTIEELKPSLDNEIARINIPGMMNQFMRELVSNSDEWIAEDENKISRFVIDFFVETAFGEFANRTITSFLKDKYQNKLHASIDDSQLTELIYHDWMKLLTEKASPLFYFNNSVWTESETSKLAFLSFPAASAPIMAAAKKMQDTSALWGLKKSQLTDRIFVMCSACGLPLAAYNNCSEYEQLAYTARAVGRHYYEGKPNPTIKFTDWNKLPSVTPQCLINTAAAPEDMRNLLNEARELYKKCREMGLIDVDSNVYELDPSYVEKVESAIASCKATADATTKLQEVSNLDAAIEAVNQLAEIKLVPSGFSFPSDGYRQTEEDIWRIQEDHFIYSPAAQVSIVETIEQIDALKQKIAAAVSEAGDKATGIKSSGNAVGDYCDAVFTGVIALEGRTVTYHRNVNGIMTDIALSKYDEGFDFKQIPVYQGFLTYQKLDAEMRKEIKKLVNDRFNADAPELLTTGKALKETLVPDRFTAWAQIAANFEQQADIMSFLGELNKRFNTYCLENGY